MDGGFAASSRSSAMSSACDLEQVGIKESRGDLVRHPADSLEGLETQIVE